MKSFFNGIYVMGNNLERIKTYVLNVEFDQLANIVIRLSKTISYKSGPPNDIPFDKLQTISREGNIVNYRGHYTTQKLFDAMYISFAGKLNNDEISMLLEQDQRDYMEIWNRAYDKYPEILI